jgi:hypothetical protein
LRFSKAFPLPRPSSLPGPSVLPAIAALLQSLRASPDPAGGLASIFDLVSRTLTHSIDGLTELWSIEFLLSVADEELAQNPIDDALVLAVFDSLNRFSGLAMRRLAAVRGRFWRLICSPACVIPSGIFLGLICSSDRDFALGLVLDYGIFDEILRLVQEAQESLDYVGQLFNFLAIVVEHIDVR